MSKHSCDDFDRKILGILQDYGSMTASQIQDVLWENRKYKWWFGPSYGKVMVSLNKLEDFNLIEGYFIPGPCRFVYKLTR